MRAASHRDSSGTAFAGYQRVRTGGTSTSCFPAVMSDLVMGPWESVRPSSHLEPIDVVGEHMLDALTRVIQFGEQQGVIFTGEVDSPTPRVQQAAKLAKRFNDPSFLTTLRPVVRAFTVQVEGEVRAHFRSDGVIFVEADDKDRAVKVAKLVLEVALNARVEVPEDVDP